MELCSAEIDTDDKLKAGSRIGCSVLNSDGDYDLGIITTSGYEQAHYSTGDIDPQRYFYSDSEHYYVGLTGTNEVRLYIQHILPLTGGLGIWYIVILAGLVLVKSFDMYRKHSFLQEISLNE